MRQFLPPVILAAVVIGIAAYVQGEYTQRWRQRAVSEQLKSFAERLELVPAQFGDWESKELPGDERQLSAAEVVGSVSRVYENKLSPGKVFQVFLVCGHGRPITQHTPDRCYPASGYKPDEEERRIYIPVGDSAAEFKTNHFRKSGADGGELRVYWSFNGKGEWVAPITERWSLTDEPALYKIYVITSNPIGTDSQFDEMQCKEFLEEFIPAMDAVLFPPKSEGDDDEADSSTAPGEPASQNDDAAQLDSAS